MWLVDGIAGFGSWLLIGAPAFLFILTVVVFFHELGHFWVARRCGVTIDVFSVGFGPELIGRTDRHGTRWKLAAVPLGGYVKFHGDENAASMPDAEAIEHMSEDERKISLAGQSVWRRMAIVAAGPIANIILAILIFTGLFTIYGQHLTAPKVESVLVDSAAEAAGLKPGDVVLSIDGRGIESFSDIQAIVTLSADTPIEIVLDRGGERIAVTAVPKRQEMTDPFGNKHRVGVLGISRSVSRDDVIVKRYSLPEAFVIGTKETYNVVERSFTYLGRLIRGRESTDQLGGPIRIAKTSGDVAAVGFSALINMMAIISVSIGILNLFPIPVLDGGHLLYYAIEAIRGRPLSARVQDYGFRIGFALILMLIIFVTSNDIISIVSQHMSG